MKNKLQLFLAIIMTAAAFNASAATPVESDVRVGSDPGSTPVAPQTAKTETQWKSINGVSYDGRFELAQGDQCIRVLADFTLRMQPCRSGGIVNWAFWKLEHGGIKRAGLTNDCLWAPDVIFANPRDKKVNAAPCPNGMHALVFGNQTIWRVKWTLVPDGRIVLMGGLLTDGKNLKYSKFEDKIPHCLEYSPQLGRVIVAPCAYKKPTQTWKFFTEHVKG